MGFHQQGPSTWRSLDTGGLGMTTAGWAVTFRPQLYSVESMVQILYHEWGDRDSGGQLTVDSVM